MKRMGVDFGSKKIGIALTDDSGAMAFPYEVVPNDNKFLSYIEALVHEKKVKEIIVGHSVNNQGQDNPVHALVTEFITDVTLSLGIPVHLEPEFYSTQQATKIQGKSSMTDASAAALILDSYITRQKTNK